MLTIQLLFTANSTVASLSSIHKCVTKLGELCSATVAVKPEIHNDECVIMVLGTAIPTSSFKICMFYVHAFGLSWLNGVDLAIKIQDNMAI